MENEVLYMNNLACGLPFSVENFSSVLESKIYRYAQESYFQESWYDFDEQMSACNKNITDVDDFTFIVFKPDAAPVRCVSKTINYLRNIGLVPVYYSAFTFDRLLMRELWRYELNLASKDRYPLIDQLLTAGKSVFVLLKRYNSVGNSTGLDGLSASQLVKIVKGPSCISKRKPSDLRSYINAKDANLNHIHSPDETLDVIREIGVLFTQKERSKIIKCILVDAEEVSTNDIEHALYDGVLEHSLDLEDVFRRLSESAPGQFRALEEYKERSKLHKLLSQLDKYDVPLTKWDRLVIM